jgi:hypothetical protein
MAAQALRDQGINRLPAPLDKPALLDKKHDSDDAANRPG